MPAIFEMLEQAIGLHRGGNLAAAEQIYRQILVVEPNQPDAWHLLGIIATQSDKPQIAIDFVRRAIAAKPTEPEFHRTLAAAYKASGDTDNAAGEYRETLRLQPDSVLAHVFLAGALMEQGKLDEALEHSLEALRLDPESPLAFCDLGELAGNGQYTLTSHDIGKMQEIAVRPGQPPRDACLVYFTLAGHWEQTGDYQEAFRCYRAANELKRQVYREANRLFDPKRHLQLIDGLISTFTPELFESFASAGSASEQPIFVVGMPRSGTSLVEQILASLPGVFGAGELRDMNLLADSISRRVGTNEDYPASVLAAGTVTLQSLAHEYLATLNRLSGGGANRVVDKMPHNYLHLGLIALLFPRARIVYCRRDVMDVCLATYCQNFEWLPYASDLAEIGFYYRHLERLTEHWRRVLPLPIHEVVYEDMVGNQETESRKLVAFCGLEWDDRCLEFYKSKRTVQTASKLQVRRPIYKSSVARWKRFESHLQPLREALADPNLVLRSDMA